MNILCTLSRKCFPLVPQSLKRKFITLWSKFKMVTPREKKKTHPIPLLKSHMSLIELQSDWDEMRLRNQRGVSLHLSITLPSSPPSHLFLRQSIVWVECIMCCEGAVHDKHGPGISLGMNGRPRFDPTRRGKHMFCWSWLPGYLQRGLGILPAGGTREWWDGDGASWASMCLFILTQSGCWHICLGRNVLVGVN